MSEKKPIDKAKFEELLDEGKSKIEICAIFSCSENKMTRWIYENYQCKFTDLVAPMSKYRPHKKIDKNQFEELCKLCCTQEEIEKVLGTSYDTINEWCKREYGVGFSEVQRTYAIAGAKLSLRRSQLKLAETNAQMAIWLGKQLLGQRDVVEQEIRATVNETDSQIIEMLADKVNLEELENQDEQSEDNQ